MPMTAREMRKYLEINGFILSRTKGSHMFFENPKTNKKTTVPNHSGDLKKGLENAILKQAGLK